MGQDSNPQPLDRESSLLSTRPGFRPDTNKFSSFIVTSFIDDPYVYLVQSWLLTILSPPRTSRSAPGARRPAWQQFWMDMVDNRRDNITRKKTSPFHSLSYRLDKIKDWRKKKRFGRIFIFFNFTEQQFLFSLFWFIQSSFLSYLNFQSLFFILMMI